MLFALFLVQQTPNELLRRKFAPALGCLQNEIFTAGNIFAEWKQVHGSIPLRRMIEMDLNRLVVLLQKVVLTERLPIRRHNLN